MQQDAAKANAASATATTSTARSPPPQAQAFPSRPKGATKSPKKLRLFIYVQFSPYTKIVRTVLRTSQ